MSTTSRELFASCTCVEEVEALQFAVVPPTLKILNSRPMAYSNECYPRVVSFAVSGELWSNGSLTINQDRKSRWML
jgi:hypothetical protein